MAGQTVACPLESGAPSAAVSAKRRYIHFGAGLFLLAADASQNPPRESNMCRATKAAEHAEPAPLVRLGLFRAIRVAESEH